MIINTKKVILRIDTLHLFCPSAPVTLPETQNYLKQC